MNANGVPSRDDSRRRSKYLIIGGTTCAVVAALQFTPAHAAVVIGVAGNQERAEHLSGQQTEVDPMLALHRQRGDTTIAIDYKSSVWPDGPYTHDESITDGEQNLNAVLDQVPAGSYTVILGHSLGSPISQSAAARVNKVITYGDPGMSTGIYGALPGIYPGTSSPGAYAPAPNQVRICNQYDGICDTRAPWSDPAYFVQSVAGYLTGRHTSYTPGEGENLKPGEYTIPAPPPIPQLPASTPTGLPAAKPTPLPKWEPGPLPNFAPGPYQPTPVRDYVPAPVQKYIPKPVLDYTPPPVEQIAPQVTQAAKNFATRVGIRVPGFN